MATSTSTMIINFMLSLVNSQSGLPSEVETNRDSVSATDTRYLLAAFSISGFTGVVLFRPE